MTNKRHHLHLYLNSGGNTSLVSGYFRLPCLLASLQHARVSTNSKFSRRRDANYFACPTFFPRVLKSLEKKEISILTLFFFLTSSLKRDDVTISANVRDKNIITRIIMTFTRRRFKVDSRVVCLIAKRKL